MGKVVADITMTLDGYVAYPSPGPWEDDPNPEADGATTHRFKGPVFVLTIRGTPCRCRAARRSPS